MGAVAAVDALHKVVTARVGAVLDQVQTGAVQRDGVQAGQDADVAHAGVLGHGAAVTVDGQVLHHGHVGNLAGKVVGHGAGGVGHGLQEGILRADVLPQHGLILDLAAGVDVGLAGAGSTADGQLLQCAAVTAHGVALKVDQNQHAVVVFDALTQQVLAQDLAILHGPDNVRSFGIHDVNVEQVAPAVLFHQLYVLGGLVAGAAVSSVALDHGAVDGVDDRLHELGTQEVLVAILAAVDFNGHLAGQFHAQLAVHLQHGLRGDLLGEIDSRLCHKRFPPLKYIISIETAEAVPNRNQLATHHRAKFPRPGRRRQCALRTAAPPGRRYRR